MSDLLKDFSFDLQRFEITVLETGLTSIINLEDIKGLSSAVETDVSGGLSTFHGGYFWNGSASLIDGTFFNGMSGVQVQIKYDAYQVTGLSVAGGASTDIYTFYNITGVSEIDFNTTGALESNEVTFTKLSSGSESNIIITSDYPVSLKGISINDFNFSSLAAGGVSFSLDEIVLRTDIAGYSYPFVDSVSFTNGTMYVSEHIKKLIVNGGSDPLTVDKPFSYTVNGDDNILSLTETGTFVESFDGATQVVPVAAEEGQVTVGNQTFAYTSGGSAAVIIDGGVISGFAFGGLSDKVSISAGAPSGFGVRYIEDNANADNESEVSFTNLSASGYTAELVGLSAAGVSSTYQISITPNAKVLQVNDSLSITNASGSMAIVINEDGELQDVELTGTGDALSGDLSFVEIAGDSSFFSEVATATLTYMGEDLFRVSGLSANDALTFDGVTYSFNSVGADNVSVTFSGFNRTATAAALSGITAGASTVIEIDGISSATTTNINGQALTINQDFTYSYNTDDVVISVEGDNVDLTATGDATRVYVSGDSATILGSEFSEIEFASDSSGFIVNGSAVTGVIMDDDGDTFTTNATTAAAGVSIANVTMAGLSNLADQVSFTRNGSASDADTSIEVRGFQELSIVDGQDGSQIAIAAYGARDDIDDGLAVTVDKNGNITGISDTFTDDVIRVTGATGASGISIEDSYIKTGSGSFAYAVGGDSTALLLLKKNDTVELIGGVDIIQPAAGSSSIALEGKNYAFSGDSAYFSVGSTSAGNVYGFNFMSAGDYISGGVSSLILTYGDNESLLVHSVIVARRKIHFDRL